MFEHKSEPVLARSMFLRRLAASSALGLALVVVSLAAGMVGYRTIEGLSWVDAFLNASMLLGGMGPLEHERDGAGKIFEGLYALYCGLAVITVSAIIFAPVIHRFMHKLHADDPETPQPTTHRHKAPRS
ncbi:MAG: hypothetical protein WC538_02985 [Thermoanaerobaculia bacterium]|jgi:hypothetical protein